MKHLFLLGILLFSITANSQTKDSADKFSELSKMLNDFFGDIDGKELPAFTAKDLEGKTYTNKNILAKATFLNFWFAGCQPCIAEIPHLNRLYKTFKDSTGVQFYSITYETEENARKAVNKHGINYPVVLVSHDTAKLLNFGRGYPTNIILDGKGKIRYSLSGGSKETAKEIDEYFRPGVERLLKGGPWIEVAKPVESVNKKSDIVFIDSFSKIQSFNELINYFKGQSLFIDLWASWCLPCRQEFLSKNSVNSFLSDHQIARLFISVDDPKATENWKSLIYKYQLRGYHFLAGKELIEDLKQKVYRSETIDLPRYIIVKEGKIVELNAFRPSDDKKLINQLSEKLF
ncbi:MAG: redoxin domain-containing protein [Bacteroidota bacterium]|nr:redoxin domain-containing protein [Bacteroidota bacterium]